MKPFSRVYKTIERRTLMKRNVFFTILMVIFVNVAVFSQTAVNVPSNFTGTWWIDASNEKHALAGIQVVASIEIKRDGTWILRSKVIAYNQSGLQLLKENGVTNGQTKIAGSGYVTGATSVEILLTQIGETQVFDRFKIDGNDILDSQNKRWTKREPQVRRE